MAHSAKGMRSDKKELIASIEKESPEVMELMFLGLPEINNYEHTFDKIKKPLYLCPPSRF
jgi:hypothetical protein